MTVLMSGARGSDALPCSSSGESPKPKLLLWPAELDPAVQRKGVHLRRQGILRAGENFTNGPFRRFRLFAIAAVPGATPAEWPGEA